MNIFKGFFASLVAVALLVPACAEEEGDVSLDATLRDGAADTAPAPDLRPAVTCEVACTSQGSHLCVTDQVTGVCVECQKDEHCAVNAGALGSRCRNKLCVCNTDDQCKGKKPGARCLGDGPASCGCEKDTDCAAPWLCVGTLFSASVCGPPCKNDKDCASNKDRPYCNTATGKCGACLVDKHCDKGTSYSKYCHPTLNACVPCKRHSHCTSSSAPYCDASTGKCAACVSDSHCTGHPYGSRCKSDGTCGCKDAADCKEAAAYGALCPKSTGRCGCVDVADCKGKSRGPACSSKAKRCACTADKECTAPWGSCAEPYKGAGYKQCKLACKTDSDCPTLLRPACKTSSGTCVGCLKDSHCTALVWADRCKTSSSACVECEKNEHCTADTLGSTCDSGRCICAKDADCAKNSGGTHCLAAFSVCGCTTNSHCPAGKTCVGKTDFGALRCQ